MAVVKPIARGGNDDGHVGCVVTRSQEMFISEFGQEEVSYGGFVACVEQVGLILFPFCRSLGLDAGCATES